MSETLYKRVTKAELMDALENLTARFPIEHGTVLFIPGEKTHKPHCKCLQFEDHDECRHTLALRTLEKAYLK